MWNKKWFIVFLTSAIAVPFFFAYSGWLHSEEIYTQEVKERDILTVIDSRKSKAGPLLMKQPLPSKKLEQIDPFLLLHHHGPEVLPANNTGLPFGPHPHRGFETVTFIYHGDVAHRDSKGFESVIESGGIQYMTAGRGIVHSERSSEKFKKEGGKLEIIQIWINLPSALKGIEPNYQGLQKNELKAISMADGKVNVQLVSGKYNEMRSKATGAYPITLMNVEIETGGEWVYHVPVGENVLFYVLEGSLTVNQQKVSSFQMIHFGNAGSKLSVRAHKDSRILLGHAAPINETVVSYGPFVMNTMEEIQDALDDYAEGRMGVLIE